MGCGHDDDDDDDDDDEMMMMWRRRRGGRRRTAVINKNEVAEIIVRIVHVLIQTTEIKYGTD